jgi:hypothetical protein
MVLYDEYVKFRDLFQDTVPALLDINWSKSESL